MKHDVSFSLRQFQVPSAPGAAQSATGGAEGHPSSANVWGGTTRAADLPKPAALPPPSLTPSAAPPAEARPPPVVVEAASSAELGVGRVLGGKGKDASKELFRF